MRPLTAVMFVVVLVAMLMVSRMLGFGGGNDRGKDAAALKSTADEVESRVGKSLEQARERLTEGLGQAGAE